MTATNFLTCVPAAAAWTNPRGSPLSDSPSKTADVPLWVRLLERDVLRSFTRKRHVQDELLTVSLRTRKVNGAGRCGRPAPSRSIPRSRVWLPRLPQSKTASPSDRSLGLRSAAFVLGECPPCLLERAGRDE
jgi:hypothetical protein